MANRLAQESSPYLLQHADNPVDWYPWGEEAFRRAREEDKPIFLSIGYAACHWCHVMEHESFENEDTARYLNRHFVAVKVDREERPDLDDIYMQAVVGITGRGGWPMSVWLTPEGAPFLGGTYYPDSPRMGMPSFRQVLEFVVAKWEEERDQITQTADQLTGYLREEAEALTPAAQEVSKEYPAAAREDLEQYFDERNAGWGRSPKFPQGMAIDFLLHLHHRTGDEAALSMATSSLSAMAAGGIYDQIGGGFHRYSVDAYWLVPHFEKMLYDNALLARAYLHGYLTTGETSYRVVAEEILDYVLREMTHPEGGFYSTQDADSEGEEGKFFVWSPEEVRKALAHQTEGDARVDPELILAYYGVTPEGNFEGKNVLHRAAAVDDLAERFGLSAAEVRGQVARARRALFVARDDRVKPARDEKILTGWNGLILTAFAEAARYLENDAYREAAVHSAGFLRENLRRENGRLLRTWRDGRAKLNAYLEDYAALTDGLISLYQTTFDERWYTWATELADTILERFTVEGGGFYDTSDDHEQLVARPRSVQDNAIPSGGSLATTALLRLSALSGEGRYLQTAEDALKAMANTMTSQSVMFGQWLTALELAVSGLTEVAVVGPPEDPATVSLVQTVNERFRPFTALACRAPAEKTVVPLLQGREPGEAAAAWVCRNFACERPVTDVVSLRERLETS